MLFFKIILLIVAIFYSIYLYQYAQWEKRTKQNPFGSFILKTFIVIDFIVLTLTFFDKLYYDC